MNRYDWHRWWLTWLLGTERRRVGYIVTEAMCPRLAGTLEGRWEYRKLERDEAERFLREPKDKKWSYAQRQVVGVEIVEPSLAATV